MKDTDPQQMLRTRNANSFSNDADISFIPETNSCSETWLSSERPLLSDLLGLYSEMIHSTPCFSYHAISVLRMEGRQCSATDPKADNSYQTETYVKSLFQCRDHTI